MRSPLAFRFVVPCLFISSLASAARADEDWSRVSDKHGMLLERRRVEGSSFYELRTTLHSPLPAARIYAALWADRKDGKSANKYRRERQVLRETPDERVVYEKVKTPVVSDRDYVVRLRRSSDPAAGRFRLEFQTLDSERPPTPGLVRVRTIRGHWEITAAKDGGSDIVYQIHSDPSGRVPAFMVHNAQADASRELVEEVLAWTEAHPDLR